MLRLQLHLLQLHELELLLRHGWRIHRDSTAVPMVSRCVAEHGLRVGRAQVLGGTLAVASIPEQVFVFADLVLVLTVVL